MLKNFLMKQMLKAKMKDVPKEEQEKIFSALEKDPGLFEKIAKETQEAMKGGKDQMTAAMEVAMRHKDELQKVLGK